MFFIANFIRMNHIVYLNGGVPVAVGHFSDMERLRHIFNAHITYLLPLLLSGPLLMPIDAQLHCVNTIVKRSRIC